MIVNASIFSVLQGIAGGNHILFFQWRGKQIEQIDNANSGIVYSASCSYVLIFEECYFNIFHATS